MQLSLNRRRRDVEDQCRLLVVQTTERPKFDQFCESGIDLLESIECRVEGEDGQVG